MRLFLYVVILAFTAQPVAAAHFGDALAAYFLQDYDKAYGEWQVLATEGDRDSQFYLGLLHETGNGAVQDYAIAIDWYLRSAESGHAEAAYRLARLARQTAYLPAEPDAVLQWIEQAANGGIADAQYELGAVFAEGTMVERDLKTAHSWFLRAEQSFTDSNKQQLAAQMRQVIEARIEDY